MIGTRPFLTSDHPELCDTGSLHGDLEALAQLVLDRLRGLDLELAHRLHDSWSRLDRERVAGILHRAGERGELAEHGEGADPEFVRAMLVGPVAWPLLSANASTPPTGAVAELVSATLQR
ncbi:MAG: Tetracyclin repressor-like, C-terminal domain [Conexibacter sp.]|jgi:hypothetical protein|nr:Tetracyclin repressor-like, C-terminal domain [Conexibacter sp.]MCZ4493744.1 Tetracyclin repressor-like, C-terminal domain [Conexibacter sp.]MDX6713611.1 Tetracyclin repressor-like, C-terminal domain [Baekduia sp.]